jgi:hypothetical protein
VPGTTIHVTNDYGVVDGNTAQGKVEFAPLRAVQGVGFTIVARPVSFNLTAGALDAQIVSNDLDLTNLYIRVREFITGTPMREFVIKPEGVDIDLSVYSPQVPDIEGYTQYVRVDQLGLTVPTLVDGKVPVSQLPAAAGGSDRFVHNQPVADTAWVADHPDMLDAPTAFLVFEPDGTQLLFPRIIENTAARTILGFDAPTAGRAEMR